MKIFNCFSMKNIWLDAKKDLCAANSLEWIAYARTQGGTDFRSQPYLAPDVFKRQIHKREVPAVTLLKLTCPPEVPSV